MSLGKRTKKHEKKTKMLNYSGYNDTTTQLHADDQTSPRHPIDVKLFDPFEPMLLLLETPTAQTYAAQDQLPDCIELRTRIHISRYVHA